MKHLWTATVFTALLVLTPSHAAAQATVTVEVTNRTAGGASVVGDEVTLMLYQGEQAIDSKQTKVAEDARAVFENVPTAPGRVAVARVKHQNMAFRGRPVSLDPNNGESSSLVEVFDVSTDMSKLSVGAHHVMIAVRGASLECTEYMQLSNCSDKAVTSSQRDDKNRPVVVRIELPEGFKDLTTSSYFEPEALVIDRNGFYDTMAVPPGEHHVSFSYKLAADRGGVKIVKPFTLPTSEVTIFWESGPGKLKDLGEPDGRLVNEKGTLVEFYRRTDLKPGDTLAFQIVGFRVRRADSYTWAVLVAVFAGVVVVALSRSRPRPAESGQEHA